MAASLLDSAISAAVADIDQYDVMDELDQLEQAESEATLPTEQGRSKRGIDGKCIGSCEGEKFKSRVYFLQRISSMLWHWSMAMPAMVCCEQQPVFISKWYWGETASLDSSYNCTVQNYSVYTL